MRCSEIITRLELLSPPSFAEEWDNVGLQIGRMDEEITGIYIAVDATDAAIEEAVHAGADMLLTHHPLLFKGLKSVNEEDFIGRRVRKLIQNDICYYAMHTNFDVLGMADAAAEEMNLSASQVLHVTFEDDISKEGIGRYGKLPRMMTLKECAEYVKQRFSLQGVRVYGDLRQMVDVAAISPGSGKSVIDSALQAGVEVLITGDIDHHEGIDAVARDMAIIDAGHYGLEKIFVPYMKDFLHRQVPGVKIFTQEPRNPFVIV